MSAVTQLIIIATILGGMALIALVASIATFLHAVGSWVGIDWETVGWAAALLAFAAVFSGLAGALLGTIERIPS